MGTNEFDVSGVIQVAGIPFIGVNMYFQFAGRIGAYEQPVEDDTTVVRYDAEVDTVPLLHTVISGVPVIHMNMPFRSDDPFGQFHDPGRPNQYAT